jgi:catechol 2,3-dioxygenase-like lactoylglutathione lyase family enzyme
MTEVVYITVRQLFQFINFKSCIMKIKQIKETCIYVKDLETSRKFYQEQLGLDLIGKVENRHVFFRAGSSVLLCFIAGATQNGNSLPSHSAVGNIHLAFEVNKEDYHLWKEKVEKNNIEIIQEQSWKNGLKSFYFRDPDNNLLEIVPEGIWD